MSSEIINEHNAVRLIPESRPSKAATHENARYVEKIETPSRMTGLIDVLRNQ